MKTKAIITWHHNSANYQNTNKIWFNTTCPPLGHFIEPPDIQLGTDFKFLAPKFGSLARRITNSRSPSSQMTFKRKKQTCNDPDNGHLNPILDQIQDHCLLTGTIQT